MTLLNHPHIVFSTVEAAQAAADAMDDGEEFTFTVVIDPTGTGKAIVAVYDIADGAFIAYV
jgi:hypothetical protein